MGWCGAMGKGSKTGCWLASHQLFKDKAKNRVDDLQGMFSDLQSARKESRTTEVAILEEQVHQMLREWKAELIEPSPASSLLGNTHVSSELPLETLRLLQLSEEDDATSKMSEPALGNAKAEPLDVAEPNVEKIQGGAVFQQFYLQDYYVNQELAEHGFPYGNEYQSNLPTESDHAIINCLDGTSHLDYQQFSLHQELHHNLYLGDYLLKMRDPLPDSWRLLLEDEGSTS